jgi:hypothetical protein
VSTPKTFVHQFSTRKLRRALLPFLDSLRFCIETVSHFASTLPRIRKFDFMHCFHELVSRKGSITNCPSMRFFSLQRFQIEAATYIELASLDCAPPSGFLDLLTFYSASTASALSHAESVLGIFAFRGFPLPVAATAFTAPTLQPSASPFIPSSSFFRGKTKRSKTRDTPKIELRRALSPMRPIALPGSRIHASGRSVHSEAVLPNLHRPILS